MKNTLKLFTLFLSAFAFNAIAQTDETVCHTPVTEKFAMFASNKSFNKSHLNPLPYVHISEAGGKMIKIKTDGAEANGYLIEAKKKTNN